MEITKIKTMKDLWWWWLGRCKGNMKFASSQWNLYFSGYRGPDLHDNAINIGDIILMNKLHYK